MDLLVVSQLALKPKVNMVAPTMQVAIASFIVSNVEVATATVAYVVWKPIFQFWWKRSNVGLTKCHPVAIGLWLKPKGMDGVVAEQPTIVVLNVGVATSTIRPIVNNFALCRAYEVSLHLD